MYIHLPDIKNRPEIFGKQLKMDEDDNVVGVEEKLLISPTTLTIESLFDLVLSVKGLFIPAHVDRHSYSVLTNLGFVPDNLDIKHIEMSKKLGCIEDYLNSRPDLKQYKIFRNSDAHYLEDISQRNEYIDINNVSELFKR